MHAYLILAAVAAVGIDVGWKNRPEGGVEYLIQIEPGTLDLLKGGEVIESDIPPNVKDVRAFRITSGKGALPREEPARSTAAPGGVVGNPPPADPFAASRFFPPAQTPAPLTARPGSATPPPLPQQQSQTASAPMPRPLADPGGTPIAEKQAAFVESKDGKPAATEAKPADDQTQPQASTLWYGLIASLVALAGSVSWNVYLLWMLREARRRYRALLQRSGITEEEVAEMDLDAEGEQDE